MMATETHTSTAARAPSSRWPIPAALSSPGGGGVSSIFGSKSHTINQRRADNSNNNDHLQAGTTASAAPTKSGSLSTHTASTAATSAAPAFQFHSKDSKDATTTTTSTTAFTPLPSFMSAAAPSTTAPAMMKETTTKACPFDLRTLSSKAAAAAKNLCCPEPSRKRRLEHSTGCGGAGGVGAGAGASSAASSLPEWATAVSSSLPVSSNPEDLVGMMMGGGGGCSQGGIGKLAVKLRSEPLQVESPKADKEITAISGGRWSGSFGHGKVLAGGYDLGQARGFRPIRILEGAFVLQSNDEVPAVFEMRTRGSLSGPTDVLDALLSQQQPKVIDPRRYGFRMFSTIKTADKRYAEIVNCGLWVASGVWRGDEMVIDAYRVA